jgi:hypothetical protein
MRLRVCSLCLDGSGNWVCHLDPDRLCLCLCLPLVIEAVEDVRGQSLVDV